MAAFKRSSVAKLMSKVAGNTTCPCHGVPQISTSKEYAFEMASSTIRYGPGVTKEVAFDIQNLHSKKPVIFTDRNLVGLSPVKTVLEALRKQKLDFILYDQTRVEPTDSSLRNAIDFVKKHKPDSFVAVGGGSVIDTAKAANLYLNHPNADFLDFVNSPIGKGSPIPNPLLPLIAIPTTAGTGSETTGVSIFDYEPLKFKTGIANKVLKPTLGLVDPLNTMTMSKEITVASGLDVLCHSIESYTALPYSERTPRPSNPILRPAYQGSNPISDVWSLKALEMCVANLLRVYKNPDDFAGREKLILAATFAGIGFGNAGVHLCHGMSYPISGLNRGYKHSGYSVNHSIIPHGISVAVTAPAVFKFTAEACPERHLEVAKIFGVDITNKKNADAGEVLCDALRGFLHSLDVPNGIQAFGYTSSDVDNLVKGTLPQHRVTKLAPRSIDEDYLAMLFENSMKIYV